jgi:hypothetical protein
MDRRLNPYTSFLGKLKIYLTTPDNRSVIQENIGYVTEETRKTFNDLLRILGAGGGGRDTAGNDEYIRQLHEEIQKRDVMIAQLQGELNELRGGNNNYEIGSHGTLIAPNSQTNGTSGGYVSNNKVSSVGLSSPLKRDGELTRNQVESIRKKYSSYEKYEEDPYRPLLTSEQIGQIFPIYEAPWAPKKRKTRTQLKERKTRRRRA